jgi:hypothetical protein
MTSAQVASPRPTWKEHLMSEVAVGSASSAAADHAKTATIERYFAAIVAGDHAALDEVLTPDAVTR